VDGISQINNMITNAGGVGGSLTQGGVGGLGGGAGGTPAAGGVSFKDVLMKNLNEVNKLQEDADKSLEDFVTGKSDNMGEVISASQKASLAFSMLTQIRNKLQDAYDEVKNLRI
jgi:flagellar hook-basal body complex protein FliE